MIDFENFRLAANPYIVFSYLAEHTYASKEELANFLVSSYPGTQDLMPMSVQDSEIFIESMIVSGKIMETEGDLLKVNSSAVSTLPMFPIEI